VVAQAEGETSSREKGKVKEAVAAEGDHVPLDLH
jgi:hypothetical protein